MDGLKELEKVIANETREWLRHMGERFGDGLLEAELRVHVRYVPKHHNQDNDKITFRISSERGSLSGIRQLSGDEVAPHIEAEFSE